MGTRNRFIIPLAGVLALGLTACTAPGPAPSETPSEGAAVVLDDTVRAELDAILEEGFDKSGMPGVAAYVSIGDDVWQSSLGVGDLNSDAAFDPAANVRIASITKTFVGTAVLQLVDAGELALDDTLDQFVPGMTNGDKITIRDLLHMSSGLWDFTSDAELIDRWAQDPTMPWTVADTIALAQGKPEQFAPGDKVLYTDTNYVLLGEIIEQVTGMTTAQAIQSMIIDPLALADTRFPAAGEIALPDPHQQGYRPPGQQLEAMETLIPISDINPEVAAGAGNMMSTLADLVVWAKALALGDLLSPELQAERIESQPFDGQTIEFGYGLGIIRLGDVLGHDGAIMGYSSVAMHYPDADATFVLVGNASSNSSTPTMDIFLAMLQRLYPDQLRPLS